MYNNKINFLKNINSFSLKITEIIDKSESYIYNTHLLFQITFCINSF